MTPAPSQLRLMFKQVPKQFAIFFQIGQAYDLKTVSPEIIKQRTHRTGDGTHRLWGWDDPEFNEKLKEKYGMVSGKSERKIE